MPSKNPAQRLRDIVDNVDSIIAFTAGLTFEDFAGDRKTVYAVVRALEIVSEASRRLPEELKSRRPEIDWVAVAAAGNIYRHEFDVVDVRLIWHTLRTDLGTLGDAHPSSRRPSSTSASFQAAPHRAEYTRRAQSPTSNNPSAHHSQQLALPPRRRPRDPSDTPEAGNPP